MRTGITAIIFAFSAASATAATVGFDLTISGNANVPTFTLQNTSITAELDTFSVSIGDTAFNFDFIQGLTAPTGGAAGINQGGTGNGGLRNDAVVLGFTSFDPSDSATWTMDIDKDSANSTEDFRSVMFNNGAADNAVARAYFSTGAMLELTLPDGALQSSYSFSATGSELPPSVVPLPAGMPLLLAGLGLLATRRRR